MRYINTNLVDRDDGAIEAYTNVEASGRDLVYLLANILYTIENNYGAEIILEAIRVHRETNNKTVIRNEHGLVDDGNILN